MSLGRYRGLLISSLIISALSAIHVVNTNRILAAQNQPYGCYSRRQIVARTAQLCALFMESADIRLSASILAHEGPCTRHFWTVDCTDTVGEHLAYFTWDADTGDLYNVAHRRIEPSSRGAAHLRIQEAEQIARRWLNDPGITGDGHPSCKGEASQWRLAETPAQVSGKWHITWRAEGRLAIIEIDFRSGELAQAKIWRQYGQP